MMMRRPSFQIWPCTGFAAGRPPGRPLQNRMQAMKMNAGRKKITANGLVRRGLSHEGFCYHGRSFLLY